MAFKRSGVQVPYPPLQPPQGGFFSAPSHGFRYGHSFRLPRSVTIRVVDPRPLWNVLFALRRAPRTQSPDLSALAPSAPLRQ